jgi:hypothetical protein
MALRPISIIAGGASHRENSLRVPSFGRLEERVVILNGLEDLGVAVGRFDEAGTLALKNRLGAGGGGVDERDDLETGTELVLESERVAADAVSDMPTCVRELGSITHFHGPSSDPNMMFPAPIMTTLKSAPGSGGGALNIAVGAMAVVAI